MTDKEVAIQMFQCFVGACNENCKYYDNTSLNKYCDGTDFLPDLERFLNNSLKGIEKQEQSNLITQKQTYNSSTLGIATWLQQTAEECAELSQAVLKLLRVYGFGQKTEKTEQEVIENLKLEMADVIICIEALQYLLNIDFNKEKESQINKVYERINNNEY